MMMTPPAARPAPAAAHATLTLLWERVRERGDLPAFTRAISAILCAMRGEDDLQFCMARTILSDPVLTHKVLRLANSGMYAAFGQRISTVSRAVLVLGTEAIGHLALGLKVIEEVARPANAAPGARAEMEKAVLAGMVAREIGAAGAPGDGEEAVVCAMLHSLGRMMVTYYLPERWSAMQAHTGASDEEQAAIAVLGMTLAELGRATARRWGLPGRLIDSMRDSEPRAHGAAATQADWLTAVSTLAARCAAVMWHDSPSSASALHALAADFAPLLGMTPEHILRSAHAARDSAASDLTIPAPVGQHGASLIIAGMADLQAAARARPEQQLSMALETLHKGLAFTRTLAFVRDQSDGVYRVNMGFGGGAEALIRTLLFPTIYQADVFHAALASDRVIFIRQAHEPQFAQRLPAWWTAALGDAGSFVIAPLLCKGKPVGLLYGDWVGQAPPQLGREHFAALDQLRAHAADACAAIDRAGHLRAAARLQLARVGA